MPDLSRCDVGSTDPVSEVSSCVSDFGRRMSQLDARKDHYIPDLILLILTAARDHRATDIHLVPQEQGMQMHWRIDGVLVSVALFAGDVGPRMIARLKVISGLLTYRTDLPQEGRVAREFSTSELRVTTFPTLHGEKAAVRLFAENDRLQNLSQLGFEPEILAHLQNQLSATDGVILLTGPSGSGKTTTGYACLREILRASRDARSIMTLEDPIEVAVSGVTQSQVRPSVGFDLATGLKSLMRQDPDVILVGEIRDPATAEGVFQASLTGHLVITTFHAGSCIDAIARLTDMNIEPYLIRSALRFVICQRLVRKLLHSGSLSDNSAGTRHPGTQWNINADDINTDIDSSSVGFRKDPQYHGRMVLAETLNPETPEIASAILRRSDTKQLASIAASGGFRSLFDAGAAAVAEGLTTQAEIFRVLGTGNR